MNLKRKMSMGILAGALGLSLIGGGTWAAFNDVETVGNKFAAGKLDLKVGDATTFRFSLQSLKPGDTISRQLVLENKGTLDINDILVDVNKLEGWRDLDQLKLGKNGSNTEDDFLDEFSVVMKKGQDEVFKGTLKDLVYADYKEDISGTAGLDNDKQAIVGIESGKSLTLDIEVTFKENLDRIDGTRYFVQNKFQGEMSNLQFVFEATQMPGEAR